MENWIILNKLALLGFIAFRFALGGFQNMTWIVLAFLFYISLNITVYLIGENSCRQILLGASIGLLIVSARYLGDSFILLLPVNIYELVFRLTPRPWLSAGIAALPLFWLGGAIINQYILVSFLGLLLCVLADRAARRIQVLSGENDRLREKLHSIAGQLNKDREYERQLKYSSQLEERNKIAQEIHDQIGHALSGSLLQLEAARLYLDKDADRSGAIIQNVIQILRSGAENIRATLKNVKPPSEQLGLNRVKLMTEEFSIRHHRTAAFTYSGNLDKITPIQWKVIYDNIGEALTNALKHSGATAIAVRIEVLNKYIKAEVKDNGRGASRIKKGLGINGMEERSGNIGGKMIVDGSQGFSIITLLPVEED